MDKLIKEVQLSTTYSLRTSDDIDLILNYTEWPTVLSANISSKVPKSILKQVIPSDIIDGIRYYYDYQTELFRCKDVVEAFATINYLEYCVIFKISDEDK